MTDDPFSREEDATSFPGDRWFYLYGVDLFFINGEEREMFKLGPGIYIHRVDINDLPNYNELVSMLRFRKNEAKRIFRFFHQRLRYVIEVKEQEIFSEYMRKDPDDFVSDELSRKIRDSLPRQVMNLLKLKNPYFFTPISSSVPLIKGHKENTAIIDLIDEFSTTSKIQTPTIFSNQDLEMINHLFEYYNRFDIHADVKQQARLERAFDAINTSMSIVDARLRILHYWMGIESLLNLGGGLNIRIPQAVTLLSDCSLYYLCTSKGVIFDKDAIATCNENRFERQEMVKKIYLKRGKITHGQYDSPFEHQHSSEDSTKYYEEIAHIEEMSFTFLSAAILGIISLGHIPDQKEFEKANVDGFLERKNLDKVGLNHLDS